MKKRILGLLVALCIIVGLLPVTALAAASDVTATISNLDMTTAAGAVKYATMDAAGVVAEVTENDAWNVKLDNTGDVAVLSLQNITTTYAGGAAAPLLFDLSGDGALRIEVLTAIDITYKWKAAFKLAMKGGTTITSANSTAVLKITSGGSNYHIATQSCIDAVDGDLILENAYITAWSAQGPDPHSSLERNTGRTIKAAKNLTINGGTISATGEMTSIAIYVTGNLTVNNGANVTAYGEQGHAAHVDGDVAVNGGTLICKLKNGSVANTRYVLNKLPANMDGITAKYSTQAAGTDLITLPANADLVAGEVEGFKGMDKISYVQFHACFVADCTSDAPCAVCGETVTPREAHAFDADCTTADKCAYCNAVAEKKDDHTPEADDGDCTTATKCANDGCTQVVAAAPATAHTAGEDDGDCTTAIKCTNAGCTKDAVAAKAHTPATDRTYACSEEQLCEVCGKVARAAGEHLGGTATCQEKAKCESCGVEYGELGACKPADDDGDCTTDIKCAVCGEVAVAGKDAHKYTNNTDTTCDNEGCTHTRVVESASGNGTTNSGTTTGGTTTGGTTTGGTTPNPQTGDNTALVLCFSALLASAATLFFTKKRIAL